MITPDDDVLTSPSLASALPPHLLKRLERRNGATPPTKCVNVAPSAATEKEKENDIDCRSPARARAPVGKEVGKESPHKESQPPPRRRSVNQSPA